MSNFTILSSPRYDATTSRWLVDEKDNTGKVTKTWDFASRKEADGYIKDIILSNKLPDTKPKKQTKVDQEKQTTNFLEDSLKTLNITAPEDMPVNSETQAADGGWEMELLEFKSKWEEKKKEFKNNAVNLVDSIAGLYFDAQLIKRHELIAYKKEMEAADIATLLQQANVAERAIVRLMEFIELGNPSSRMFEVLAQMQKFVVDLVQSKKKFLFDVEEDFKRLKDEIMLIEATSATGEVGDSTNKIAMNTNSTKVLIQNISIFTRDTLAEMEGYMKVPSKNTRLQKKDDDFNLIEEATLIEEPEIDNFHKGDKKGLNRFEDDDE
jgi:hypothetical protein